MPMRERTGETWSSVADADESSSHKPHVWWSLWLHHPLLASLSLFRHFPAQTGIPDWINTLAVTAQFIVLLNDVAWRSSLIFLATCRSCHTKQVLCWFVSLVNVCRVSTRVTDDTCSLLLAWYLDQSNLPRRSSHHLYKPCGFIFSFLYNFFFHYVRFQRFLVIWNGFQILRDSSLNPFTVMDSP